jgi:hypothetical protein
MATVGLPDYEPHRSVIGRFFAFVRETFAVFPPIVMVLVVLGLVAMVSVPRAWKEDVFVLIALCAMHTTFLCVSPVGADHRYLLAPACALLVLAFIGWSNTLEKLERSEWSRGACYVLTITTAGLVLFGFSHSEHKPADSISPVVESIAGVKSKTGLRIVVPPTLEGPFIADFVGRSCCRLHDYLIRPSKVLGRVDWFMQHITSNFHSPQEMMRYFKIHPVDFIVWQNHPTNPLNSYSLIMRRMLETNPSKWRPQPSLIPADLRADWVVYQYEDGTNLLPN